MSAKLLKLLIVCVLLCMVAILPGELYQAYLEQYNDFYTTSFYCPDNIAPDKMISDLSETAEKNNVEIFKIYERSKTTFSTCLDVYASKEMVSVLEKDYLISEGRFRSLFSGSSEINVYDFHDISPELAKEDSSYYLYGDFDDAVLFKRQLVDIYAGSFPKEDGFNDLSFYRNMLFIGWFFVICVTVVLGIYDLMSQKKETFILTTMGTKKGSIYLKNLLIDTLVMAVVFFAIKVILIFVEGSLSFEVYSNSLFAFLLLINAIIYLGVFGRKYGTSLKQSSSEPKLLFASYILCGICMLLFLVSTSSCVELIYVSSRYSKQEEFFKEHSQYSWISRLKMDASEEPVDDYDEYKRLQGLMNTFINENPKSFFYLFDNTEFGITDTYLSYIASEGTREYLKENIPELTNTSSEYDVYILSPENSKITTDDLEDLAARFLFNGEKYKILYYSNSVKLVYRTRESEPITEMVKNPTVLFFNKDPKVHSDDGELFYMLEYGMVDDSKGLWTEYAQANSIDYVSDNAWDYYCFRWEALTRTILINLVVVLIMTAMLLLTIFVIIKLEFRVNAKELALKKIYGHTKYERFKKLYNIVGVVGFICLVGVFIMKYTAYRTLSLLYIIPILIISLAVCCIFISLQIILYEKKNLQGILKGGNI